MSARKRITRAAAMAAAAGLAVAAAVGSASVPARSSVAPEVTAAEAQELLRAHNERRRDVGIGPLRWSPGLARHAQIRADALAQRCRLTHQGVPADVGENLLLAGPTRFGSRTLAEPMAPGDVVNAWAAEAEHYSARRNRCAAGRECRHYTQIVWRSTTELGCGATWCSSGAQIWVCEYRPAGNVKGERPY